MKNHIKGLVIVLVLAMIGSLFAGCGGGGGSETKTIVIGELNDLTGAASPTTLLIHNALLDYVRYCNENGLIPGAKLKLEYYDTILDPARTTIGYEYLKGKGAVAIVTVVAWDAVMLKAAAQRDKIPIYSLSGTKEMIDPTGWVFTSTPPSDYTYPATIKWIAENHWDPNKGIPKVAYAGWDSAGDKSSEAAMKAYCQAHPDKFKWVGSYLLPTGSPSFQSEAEVLKGCDYIAVYGASAGNVMRDVAAKGAHPTYVDGGGSLPGMKDYLTSMVSWDVLDGMLVALSSLDWVNTGAQVDLAKELLDKYRGKTPAEVGQTYLSVFTVASPLVEIIGNAVKQVGADKVNGQAIYDAALEYKMDTGSTWWQGFPQWGFSQTQRYLADSFRVYRWTASEKGLVMVSDWVPVMESGT